MTKPHAMSDQDWAAYLRRIAAYKKKLRNKSDTKPKRKVVTEI